MTHLHYAKLSWFEVDIFLYIYVFKWKNLYWNLLLLNINQKKQKFIMEASAPEIKEVSL